MFCKLSDKKGFTLVELMVAVALLGIVLALGYNLFFYGQMTFTRGEAQSNVQRDIRTVSDFMTRELRNAKELDITSTIPTRKAGYRYIYLDGSRIYYAEGTGMPAAKTEPIITVFSVTRKNTNTVEPAKGRNYIQFSIEGKSGSQDYDISSEVSLNNISGKNITAAGIAIEYKVP